MADLSLSGDLYVGGNLRVSGTRSPATARTELEQNTLQVYPVPFENFRRWDAFEVVLPGTSATDDLGLYGGTFGTSQPLIRTYDVKTVGATTLYARVLVPVPIEYDAGQTLQFRIGCGMITTIADVSCTIDLQAYEVDKDNTIGVDLVTTGPQDMNDLTFANIDFALTPTGLVGGDVLDVRVAIAVNDAASVTAVIAAIAGLDLLCDVRG